MPARTVDRIFLMEYRGGFTFDEMVGAAREMPDAVIGPDVWVPVAVCRRADAASGWQSSVERDAHQREWGVL